MAKVIPMTKLTESSKEEEPRESLIIPASPGDEEKKRFKVGVIGVGATCFTIMAKDAKEAVELVEAGGGRPAGHEDAKPIGVQAYEMTAGAKPKSFVTTFARMLADMHKALSGGKGVAPASPQGIVVPKIVPPTDLKRV